MKEQITVDDLQEVIDKINLVGFSNDDFKQGALIINDNQISKEAFVRLLNQLKSIDKKKLSKTINNLKPVKNKRHLEPCTGLTAYSLNDIFDIFLKADEDITEEYSLDNLKQMYIVVFPESNYKSKKKNDIVRAIRDYIYTNKRSQIF